MAPLPYPDPPLADDVVQLRPWEGADATAIAAWGEDPEIVRWTAVPAAYTPEGAAQWIAAIEEKRAAGLTLGLAITDASTSALLGSCDLRRPDPDDEELAEIGYLLDARARGRGIATQALGLLVDWSFAALGAARVQAQVHPGNPRSAAVLERLGFRREGLLRDYRSVEGRREDSVMYARLAGEGV